MFTCHVVPVIRAVRRVVVARPRIGVATLAAGQAVRRVRRPLLVCRDAGVLAAVGSVGGTTPAIAPPRPVPVAAPGGGETGAGPGDGGGVPGETGGFTLQSGGGGGGPGGGRPGLDVLPRRLLFGPESPPLPPRGGGGGGEFTARPPDLPPVTVPEPPPLGLFLGALLVVVMMRRRWAR